MKALLLKIAAALFTLLFLISALVQYNDPDPYLWYFIYGMAAVISMMYIFEKLPFWVALIAGIACLAGVIITWPQQFEGVTIGQGDIKNIEEGREALGLLITALVMMGYAIVLRFKKV
ncbi:transmembrane 220 family protein [Robertkochia sediminum]|uniref:transmembrane 220 family protein n=1 Tax=Robertkochia sediminum TaxID=2785326 RepID=UPI0019337E01|nr:transmembrane 220 family protein [Robertkochia sediminum]MBL7474145.1 transmembrane 220 family protein [Robertkochia sediminum]